MKFGPQWIRTLTDGAAPTNNNAPNVNTTSSSSTSSSATSNQNHHNNNNNNSSNTFNSTSSSNSANNNGTTTTSKYKMAEYRYGREEMLALFDVGSDDKLDDIRRFADLFVEKPRMPMAMTPMSEEEIKQSARSWNSDAVLRSLGKMAAGNGGPGTGQGPGGLNPASGGHVNSTISERDSRQASERGTLTVAEVLSSSPRGPPGSLTRAPLGEQRGLLGSLSSRGHPSSIRNLVGRGTSLYMRSQSHDDDNIAGDSNVNSLGGPGGAAFEGRFGSSGQPRQPNSLRARFENRSTIGVSNPSGIGQPVSNKQLDIKSGIEGDLTTERRSVFDRLPGKYSADNDKIIRKDVNGRPLQSDWRSRESWSSSGQTAASGGPDSRGKSGLTSSAVEERPSWRNTRAGGAGSVEDWRSNSTNSAAASSSWYVRSDDQRNLSSRQPNQPQNQDNLNQTFSSKRDTRRPSGDEKNEDDHARAGGQGMSGLHQSGNRRDSLPEWSISDPLSGDKVGSFDASGAFREIPREDGNNSNANGSNRSEKQLHQRPQQQAQQQQPQQQQQHQQHNIEQRKQDPPAQGSDFDHLERAAEIMVEKWTAEEDNERESSSSHDFLGNNDCNNKLNLTNRDLRQHETQQANMLQNSVINGRLLANRQRQQQQQQEQLQQKVVKEQQQQQQLADPTANNQQKLVLLPFNHEDSQQWFYRDTQGVIQGPFSASEMFEWYKGGYFIKELLVRRACDELFYQLGEVIKMWDCIPFAPLPMNLPPPPPITTQTILQFRAVTKQLEMAASQVRMAPNAFADIAHTGPVLLHGPLAPQQQVHPVLAAASLNQNSTAPPDQQANIRQIIEAATRQQQQQQQQLQQQQAQQQVQQQQQHEAASIVQGQQQRAMPVNVLDQSEMQTQLRQLLAQLKSREGFSNLNAQEQQEVLVRQFVATRTSLPQAADGTVNNVGVNNVAASTGLQDQDQQAAALLQQQRARMMPFQPAFLSNDQQERLRYQHELVRRQKEEAEKQQSRLIMEQRMKAEEEKQRLMEEVQKQRQKKQMEENEKQKQEAEKERLLKLSQLKQQQLAQQQEEFKQQMQNQQRLQQQQQEEKKQQQQQQFLQQQQQQQQPKQQQVVPFNTIQQQQQQQQIERAKKAAQAQQLQQEQQQQQHRKTAWSTVSKPDREPVSLATLQRLQEEEKEREREKMRQQQLQSNQLQQQQQQQSQQSLQQQAAQQRQLTWANAAQQSKAAPVKTLAEIQKEEEERLAREKQRKTKVQPTASASASVWNNAASHLSWKNPPADS